MSKAGNISGIESFEQHYKKQFKKAGGSKNSGDERPYKDGKEYLVTSEILRKNNYPSVLHHGRKVKDCIVLTHGLTDSPYYMRAIGERFFAEGFNVIFPLLPAHGLKDPGKAMKRKDLDKMWRDELDVMVKIAEKFGGRISLGGFSTGGALSYNKILRDIRGNKKKINGCLFLFSAALELGFIDELADLPFTGVLQSLVGFFSGEYRGEGPNPYKYPTMSRIAGLELGQIIEENEDLEAGVKIPQPVFAAHSIHDTTVRIEGILDLMRKHVRTGQTFIISQNVKHEEVVLAENIKFNLKDQQTKPRQPTANPMFDWMINDAIRFFKKYSKI